MLNLLFSWQYYPLISRVSRTQWEVCVSCQPLISYLSATVQGWIPFGSQGEWTGQAKRGVNFCNRQRQWHCSITLSLVLILLSVQYRRKVWIDGWLQKRDKRRAYPDANSPTSFEARVAERCELMADCRKEIREGLILMLTLLPHLRRESHRGRRGLCANLYKYCRKITKSCRNAC